MDKVDSIFVHYKKTALNPDGSIGEVVIENGDTRLEITTDQAISLIAVLKTKLAEG